MTSSTPWQLRAAIALSALESVALVAYALAIGIAARDSRGSSITATGWEMAVYFAFAALIGLLLLGLVRRNSLARTPFLVTQAFVVIVGWTVFSGDGGFTKTVGVLILIVGVVGVVVGFTPGLMSALEGGADEPEPGHSNGRASR